MVCETKARRIVIDCCRKLYAKGYMPGQDGNVSMRVGKDAALVTPSGISKELVEQDDLVLLSLSGEVLSGRKKPTSETPIHLAALRFRPEVDAVIHTHSPNVLSFALARKNIETRSAPFAYMHLGEIGYVPYNAPGLPAFHQSVTTAIRKGHKAILFESHGSMVLGSNMQDAFAKADLLEIYARMLLGAELLGGAHKLSDQELSEIVHG